MSSVTPSGLNRIDFLDDNGEASRLFAGEDGNGIFAILLKNVRKDKEDKPNFENIFVLRVNFEEFDTEQSEVPVKIYTSVFLEKFYKLNVGQGGSKLGYVKDIDKSRTFKLDINESNALNKALREFEEN